MKLIKFGNGVAKSSYDLHRLFARFMSHTKTRGVQYLLVAAVFVWFESAPAYAQLPSGSPSIQSRNTVLEFDECVVMVIDTVDIPAKESGLISTLTARVNQEFEADALIGSLDNTTALLEDSLATVQAQVAIALSRDQSDLKFAELVLEEAKIGLDSYEQINLRGSATDAEMRSKRLAVTQAELKVQHAQQSLEQLKLKARLAQASAVASRQRLERLKITAPFGGSVLEVQKHRGEWVQAGQSILKLIRLDEIQVDTYVHSQKVELNKLVGAQVTVVYRRPNHEPLRFAGMISHYDPVVSSTGEIRIHATIQNQRQDNHWVLLPGMNVSMSVDLYSNSASTSLIRQPYTLRR